MSRLAWLAALAACSHPAGSTGGVGSTGSTGGVGSTGSTGSAGSAGSTGSTGAATMHVQLTLTQPRISSIYDFEAQVTITNRTAQPVQLNTLDLPYPSLSLWVEDAAGARVPLGPPPVPQPDDGVTAREHLAPGGTFSFRLGNPFGFDLDPGPYRVRFYHPVSRRDRAPASDWVGTLQSDWAPFEVAPPAP